MQQYMNTKCHNLYDDIYNNWIFEKIKISLMRVKVKNTFSNSMMVFINVSVRIKFIFDLTSEA